MEAKLGEEGGMSDLRMDCWRRCKAGRCHEEAASRTEYRISMATSKSEYWMSTATEKMECWIYRKRPDRVLFAQGSAFARKVN